MTVASQILSFLSEKISDSSSILYCFKYKTITKQGIGGQKSTQPSARMN